VIFLTFSVVVNLKECHVGKEKKNRPGEGEEVPRGEKKKKLQARGPQQEKKILRAQTFPFLTFKADEANPGITKIGSRGIQRWRMS
jgi:hypothetical protein